MTSDLLGFAVQGHVRIWTDYRQCGECFSVALLRIQVSGNTTGYATQSQYCGTELDSPRPILEMALSRLDSYLFDLVRFRNMNLSHDNSSLFQVIHHVWLIGCCRFMPWQYLSPYQDGDRFVTVCTHGNLIAFYHWENRPLAPWYDIPLTHIILNWANQSLPSPISTEI